MSSAISDGEEHELLPHRDQGPCFISCFSNNKMQKIGPVKDRRGQKEHVSYPTIENDV